MAKKNRKKEAEAEAEVEVFAETPEVPEAAGESEPKRLRYLMSVFGEPAGRAKFAEEEKAGKVLYA
jgi:hypothetical protein